jgi:hypothetical protein
MTEMNLQQWRDEQFVPWQKAAREYLADRQVQTERLRQHVGALQTIVGLLLEGRTKPAMLAWNTLNLHPQLRDLRVSRDGETLTLVGNDGQSQRLAMTDLLRDVQRLLDVPVRESVPAEEA